MAAPQLLLHPQGTLEIQRSFTVGFGHTQPKHNASTLRYNGDTVFKCIFILSWPFAEQTQVMLISL